MEPNGFSQNGWYPLDDPPQPLFEAMRYALDSVRRGQQYYPGR